MAKNIGQPKFCVTKHGIRCYDDRCYAIGTTKAIAFNLWQAQTQRLQRQPKEGKVSK